MSRDVRLWFLSVMTHRHPFFMASICSICALHFVACGAGENGEPTSASGSHGVEGPGSGAGVNSASGGMMTGSAAGQSAGGAAAAGASTGGMAGTGAEEATAGNDGGGGSTSDVGGGGTEAGGAAGMQGSDGGSDAGGASAESDGGGGSGGTVNAGPCADAFGATGFYATAGSGLQWTSEFWSQGAHDLPFGSVDPADPGGLATARGQGTITANGDGTLSMTGYQPRIYLGTADNHPWLNVEITVYYQRLQDDGTPWGGLVVGARGGVDGHGGDNCTATTYYARFRHDGDADFEKELEHPTSESRASKAIWPNDAALPFNQWIGMKYIVYNDGLGGVRLQAFRDLTEGVNGGDWEPILDYTDNGGWAPASNCTYEADHIIVEGGGVVFIRDTGTGGPGALYRNLTVREIDPSTLCAE